jgi:hypothetical protein
MILMLVDMPPMVFLGEKRGLERMWRENGRGGEREIWDGWKALEGTGYSIAGTTLGDQCIRCIRVIKHNKESDSSQQVAHEWMTTKGSERDENGRSSVRTFNWKSD